MCCFSYTCYFFLVFVISLMPVIFPISVIPIYVIPIYIIPISVIPISVISISVIVLISPTSAVSLTPLTSNLLFLNNSSNFVHPHTLPENFTAQLSPQLSATSHKTTPRSISLWLTLCLFSETANHRRRFLRAGCEHASGR